MPRLSAVGISGLQTGEDVNASTNDNLNRCMVRSMAPPPPCSARVSYHFGPVASSSTPPPPPPGELDEGAALRAALRAVPALRGPWITASSYPPSLPGYSFYK